MTQSRGVTIPTHHSRPVNTARAAHDNRPELEDEEKIEYIEFINRLMHRMKMDSVKRMLDVALKEID